MFAISPRLGVQIVIVLAVLWTIGCDRSHENAAPAALHGGLVDLPGVLVDSQWLSDHLSDENLVIVDARTAREYADGHVHGAIHLQPGALLDPDPRNNKNMAPIHHVEKMLGSVGLDMGRTVVIYDAGSDYRAASRVFWVMEVHGHPSVAVLDGGFSEWSQKGLPQSTDPDPRPARRFIANMKPKHLATKLSVMRAISDPATVVLDSRSAEEYSGLETKAARKGHIKNAISVDSQRNFVIAGDNVCRMEFSDELLELYRPRFAGNRKIITYCNSGNRASVSYLALRVLGYDAAVYDGSWLEWGNDPTLPIESSLPIDSSLPPEG